MTPSFFAGTSRRVNLPRGGAVFACYDRNVTIRSIRVLHDPPLPGPVNMARDEALLELVGRGESPPTLRYYAWDPPTISLGYFQKYADYAALPPPAGQLAVVRRPTGGGAILHDRELTYSIVLPNGHTLLTGGPNRLYRLVHEALLDVLKEKGTSLISPARLSCITDDSGAAKGPFFCFQRRHCLDVVVGPDKLAGSAQRRTRTSVLQHGSIVFERRYHQQPAAEIQAIAPQSPEALANAITAALTRAAQHACDAGAWSQAELQLAAELELKHRDEAWLRKW